MAIDMPQGPFCQRNEIECSCSDHSSNLPIVVGIKPGPVGGIVSLDHRGKIVWKEVLPSIPHEYLPDLYETKSIFTDLTNTFGQRIYALLEENPKLPRLRCSSKKNWFNGRNDPLWGLLIGIGIHHRLVQHSIWTQILEMRSGYFKGPKGDLEFERICRYRALKIWPKETPLLPENSKIDFWCPKDGHLGMTQAALIAEYYRRQLLRGL